MTKEYGSLPKEIREHLPKFYTMLREHHVIGAYRFIATLFEVSEKRIQQVILEERKKAHHLAEFDPSDS